MSRFLRQHKGLLLVTVLFTIVSSLSYVFIAILLQEILDVVMAGDMQKFMRTILISVVYFIFMGLFTYLQSLFSKRFVCKMIMSVRSKAFAGIERHSVEDFNKSNTAAYLSALTNDVKLVEDNYLLPLLEIIQCGIIFISSLLLMIYFDVIVTICVVAAILLMFLVPSLLGGPMAKRQESYSQTLASFTNHIKDLLSGFEVIKSYRMRKYVISKFEDSNQETITAKYAVDKTVAANESLSMLLALLVQVVVIFLSAYFIIIGRITAGALLGMTQVSSNLANPLLMIFGNVPKLKSIGPIIKRLNDHAGYQSKTRRGVKQPTFQKEISISNLHFSYGNQREVLDGLSLKITPGKKYAIIGKSGCGKTTLIKLLTGYYSNYEGSIQYDHVELSALNIDKVAELSSLIHQNVYMFDESIYDNICLHENYSEPQVQQALETSGAAALIQQIPEGLSYMVGENGANLSGGQKQRIAVARAFIRNKGLMILDEGTSAIDMQTAYDIESRLLNRNDLTLMTITHNMNKELLQLYDEIIYIEDGKLIGLGHFDTLIEHSPSFRSFFQLKTLNH